MAKNDTKTAPTATTKAPRTVDPEKVAGVAVRTAKAIRRLGKLAKKMNAPPDALAALRNALKVADHMAGDQGDF